MFILNFFRNNRFTNAKCLSIWRWLETVSAWNFEYLASSKALRTKRFFLTIFQRLKCKTFFTDSKLSQIMTGHSKFKSYLCKFKLTDSDICPCGQDAETVEQVLFHYKLILCEQDKFKKELEQLSVSWSPALPLLANCTESIDVFKNFAHCLNI